MVVVLPAPQLSMEFLPKKTGTAGNPTVAPHGVYEGFWYLFIVLGYQRLFGLWQTYKFSVWVAAYTNSTTQIASPFALEHSSSDGTNTYAPAIQLVAPASTSWNNLNWQRYDFILRYQVMATNGVIFILQVVMLLQVLLLTMYVLLKFMAVLLR